MFLNLDFYIISINDPVFSFIYVSSLILLLYQGVNMHEEIAFAITIVHQL